ncbi:heavy metal transporter [Streptomyces sp. NBC_01537]|uniref:heavy metal transporter n=1 Tax=Streptomyces sp. NBC_01537 TaxID=2903896 RepID=UPI003865CF69
MPKTPKTATTPTGGTPKKKGRLFRFTVAALVLLGIAGYVTEHITEGSSQHAGCTVTADGRTLKLEPQQAANASTIAAVASSRSLPERAVTIALATSLQESGLRNLNHGDRDSMGLFQQRPSQGWGTAAQIMDPVHASNEFFDSLVKIHGYSRLPLTVAAQKVQKSGYPQAYAKHEADAALLATALTGRVSAALNCTTATSGAKLRGGDPAKVRARLSREFGSKVTASTAKMSGTSHTSDTSDSKASNDSGSGGSGAARTVAVSSAVPSGSDAQSDEKRRGWELAQWAVAHAHELKVEKVGFRDREWQAADSGKGWQKTGAVTKASHAQNVTITVAQ